MPLHGARGHSASSFELRFPMPALIPAQTPRPGRTARLELARDEQIDAGWPLEEAELRGLMSDGGGEVRDPRAPLAGYLINSSRYGRFRVSRDGAHVAAAPTDIELVLVGIC